jgi:hypothetical protein
MQRQPVRREAQGMGQQTPRITGRIRDARRHQLRDSGAQGIGGGHPSISASFSA